MALVNDSFEVYRVLGPVESAEDPKPAARTASVA
jgi:hypothetical protein